MGKNWPFYDQTSTIFMQNLQFLVRKIRPQNANFLVLKNVIIYGKRTNLIFNTGTLIDFVCG